MDSIEDDIEPRINRLKASKFKKIAPERNIQNLTTNPNTLIAQKMHSQKKSKNSSKRASRSDNSSLSGTSKAQPTFATQRDWAFYPSSTIIVNPTTVTKITKSEQKSILQPINHPQGLFMYTGLHYKVITLQGNTKKFFMICTESKAEFYTSGGFFQTIHFPFIRYNALIVKVIVDTASDTIFLKMSNCELKVKWRTYDQKFEFSGFKFTDFKVPDSLWEIRKIPKIGEFEIFSEEAIFIIKRRTVIAKENLIKSGHFLQLECLKEFKYRKHVKVSLYFWETFEHGYQTLIGRASFQDINQFDYYILVNKISWKTKKVVKRHRFKIETLTKRFNTMDAEKRVKEVLRSEIITKYGRSRGIQDLIIPQEIIKNFSGKPVSSVYEPNLDVLMVFGAQNVIKIEGALKSKILRFSEMSVFVLSTPLSQLQSVQIDKPGLADQTELFFFKNCQFVPMRLNSNFYELTLLEEGQFLMSKILDVRSMQMRVLKKASNAKQGVSVVRKKIRCLSDIKLKIGYKLNKKQFWTHKGDYFVYRTAESLSEDLIILKFKKKGLKPIFEILEIPEMVLSSVHKFRCDDLDITDRAQHRDQVVTFWARFNEKEGILLANFFVRNQVNSVLGLMTRHHMFSLKGGIDPKIVKKVAWFDKLNLMVVYIRTSLYSKIYIMDENQTLLGTLPVVRNSLSPKSEGEAEEVEDKDLIFLEDSSMLLSVVKVTRNNIKSDVVIKLLQIEKNFENGENWDLRLLRQIKIDQSLVETPCFSCVLNKATSRISIMYQDSREGKFEIVIFDKFLKKMEQKFKITINSTPGKRSKGSKEALTYSLVRSEPEFLVIKKEVFEKRKQRKKGANRVYFMLFHRIGRIKRFKLSPDSEVIGCDKVIFGQGNHSFFSFIGFDDYARVYARECRQEMRCFSYRRAVSKVATGLSPIGFRI